VYQYNLPTTTVHKVKYSLDSQTKDGFAIANPPNGAANTIIDRIKVHVYYQIKCHHPKSVLHYIMFFYLQLQLNETR